MKVCVFQPLTVDLDVKPIIILDESNYQKEQKIEKQKQEELKKRNVVPRERIYKESIEIIGESNVNNCVEFVKQETGIDRTLGNGARNAIQGTTPQVGAIGVLRGRPHAVIVLAIAGDEITIKESNYIKNKITKRILPLTDFLGFVYF